MRTIKKHAIKRMIKASGVRRALKKTTDSAVVGIVTAILLIGLVVLVISIVQTVYVPEIMEQREAEHMDMVALQFAFLTSVIDNQAADEKIGVPIATSVTLGNRELPYLVSSKAFGSLEILERSCVITINNNSLSNPVTSTFPIGRITYSSSNAYYLDQSYTYETGAMIVSQDQGNLMMVPPNFFIEYNETTNIVNITFDVVNISGIGQKVMASGYGTYPIQTEFHSVSMQRNFTDVDKLIIIDAVKAGGKPGMIYRFHPHDVNKESKGIMSIHELGLEQSLKIMRLIEREPKEIVIIGIEPKEIDWGTELSAELQQKIPEIVNLVLSEIGPQLHD